MATLCCRRRWGALAMFGDGMRAGRWWDEALPHSFYVYSFKSVIRTEHEASVALNADAWTTLGSWSSAAF
jgi:hypothetical protein